MQEENNQLKGEVKALQESTELQNEMYEKMEKDMTERNKN